MEVKLREIEGGWDRGYALHKHTLSSNFMGNNEQGYPTFDTTRSEPGEALYLLKFRNDFRQIEPLALAVQSHILPLLGGFSLIVPMPASKVRARQPVHELAKKLGSLTKKPVFENLLVKNASNPGSQQLKDLGGRAEKLAALEGRFEIDQSVITNEGCWNVLLIDDLFDTGASMEVACTTLRSYPKIAKIFVAALTWK